MALLSEPRRAEALALVDDITSAVASLAPHCNDAGTLAEVALLVATVLPRREIDIDVEALVQRAIDAATQPMPSLGLFGQLGYASTLQDALHRLGADVDVCSHADEGLSLALCMPGTEFDLVSGCAGALCYLSERPATPLNQASRRTLLDRLFETAQRDDQGQFWQSASGERDLGLAHGVAGVVYALSHFAEAPRERALLGAAVSWLMAQRAPGEGLTYPNTTTDSGRRVAWCYCDLGISLALARAARALGRSEVAEQAHQIATRASKADDGIVDASLCHGAAGASVVFGALAALTGDAAFEAVSNRWLEQIPRFRRPEAPLGGFQFKVPAGWRDEVRLLEGAIGIALALEGACSEASAHWPRYLAFS